MSNNKKNLILIFIITELYLLANQPYVICRFWKLLNIYITTAIFLCCLIYWFLNNTNRNIRLPAKFNLAFSITIIVWGIYAVIHNDTSYLTRIILLIITYLFLLVLYRKSLLFEFWKFNNYFILLQGLLSLIGFVLVAIGLLHPLLSSSLEGKTIERPIYFFGFFFSKTLIGNLVRPSGFLDEPGALAAWAVYSFLINFAFIKDKIINRYLPVFTIVTLSVAYFIQMACYYALAYYKNIHKLVLIGILVSLSTLYINSTRNTSFDIYEKTIARFEYSDESVIEGNNRVIHMENAQKLFNKSPLIGVGGGTLEKLDEVTSDNPYEILARDGIIGFIISYLPLFFVLFNNKRREVLICVVIISIGYLQRPLHVNFMHNMYIWSLLLFALNDNYIRKKRSKNVGKMHLTF